jgi:methyl-accepting chemotaxis protein
VGKCLPVFFVSAHSTAEQEQSPGLTQINTAMDQRTIRNAVILEEMNAAGSELANEWVELDSSPAKFNLQAGSQKQEIAHASFWPRTQVA